MSIHIKVGSVWKEIGAGNMGIKVGTVWKTPNEVHINVAGTWKKVWPGVAVSALANGDYNGRLDAICYVGVKFDNNGNEYERTNTGSYGSSLGAWLDSGSASEVWVEYFNNTGTFTGKTAGTRYNLATDQEFYRTRNFVGSTTVTCQFRFWDAATGGNILQTTSSASWTAEYISSGGPCTIC